MRRSGLHVYLKVDARTGTAIIGLGLENEVVINVQVELELRLALESLDRAQRRHHKRLLQTGLDEVVGSPFDVVLAVEIANGLEKLVPRLAKLEVLPVVLDEELCILSREFLPVRSSERELTS